MASHLHSTPPPCQSLGLWSKLVICLEVKFKIKTVIQKLTTPSRGVNRRHVRCNLNMM